LSLAIVIAFTVLVTGNNPPKPSTAPSLAALAAKLAIGVGLTVVAIRQYKKMGKPKAPKKPPVADGHRQHDALVRHRARPAHPAARRETLAGWCGTGAHLAAPCSIELVSVDRRLRVDDVGCLPQRAGYPLPWPHLPQLLHHLGEQLAQRRQVQNSRLAADVRYPSGSRSLGRAARLVSDAANEDVGKARSLGQPDVLANVRVGRRIRGSTWLRILRHPDHPSSAD
jgi:hypothetical protein